LPDSGTTPKCSEEYISEYFLIGIFDMTPAPNPSVPSSPEEIPVMAKKFFAFEQ